MTADFFRATLTLSSRKTARRISIMAKKKSKAKKRPVAKAKRTVTKSKALKKKARPGKTSSKAKKVVKKTAKPQRRKAKAKATFKSTKTAKKVVKKKVAKKKVAKPWSVAPVAPAPVAEPSEYGDHQPISEPLTSDVESSTP
jgi:hypothetical protein